MKPTNYARAFGTALLFATGGPALACASCGCTLTSEWLSQGLVAQPGTTLIIRYDYVPQLHLQSGRAPLDRNMIALPADREIERFTYNHYVTATLDHQFASDWGVAVQVPFVLRPHATIGEGEVDQSTSRTRGLGDIRLVARWQGLSGKQSITGLQAGLVLPTGSFRQKFLTGPEQDEDVDRGLQPGTGTVQALVGAYHYGKLTRSLDYIVQIQGQAALDDRAGYRPGNALQLSGALHFTQWRRLTPQIELSAKVANKDSGFASDRANSGGEQVSLSPGLVAALGGRVSVFGYVQVPVYNRVIGYQLVPRVTATAGAQFRF